MTRIRSCPYILQLPGHVQLASSLVLAPSQETTMTAAENDRDQSLYSPVAYISARAAADWLKREVQQERSFETGASVFRSSPFVAPTKTRTTGTSSPMSFFVPGGCCMHSDPSLRHHGQSCSCSAWGRGRWRDLDGRLPCGGVWITFRQ
jgi:hypothetical protein